MIKGPENQGNEKGKRRGGTKRRGEQRRARGDKRRESRRVDGYCSGMLFVRNAGCLIFLRCSLSVGGGGVRGGGGREGGASEGVLCI